MSKTAFSTSDPLKKKAWEEKLFRQIDIENYWQQFSSEGTNSIVQVQTNVEKAKGDEITFGLVKNLQGDGVEDDEILEGNEESLDSSDYTIRLKQYRNAVRDKGKMSRKRVMFSIDQQSEAKIKLWGSEKQTKLGFQAIQASPTKVFYPGASAGALTAAADLATAKAALTSNTNCAISLNFITDIKAWGKTGGNRTYEPLRPIKIKGKNYFVLLLHSDVVANLKKTTEWKQVAREAAERGDDNPLFTGAIGVYDGVVIHEHELMNVGTDGGNGSQAWGQGVLMGAQSLVWAWGERGSVIKEKFDYQNEHGFAYDMIMKVEKPVFDSKDFGSLACVFAMNPISAVS